MTLLPGTHPSPWQRATKRHKSWKNSLLTGCQRMFYKYNRDLGSAAYANRRRVMVVLQCQQNLSTIESEIFCKKRQVMKDCARCHQLFTPGCSLQHEL
mmetsp:Transcript_24978/g.42518  ORF Transcript_24978/g.42518 Transcript_24978/m.42518 type:complete len:98 (+) Transcript_24978:1074-1367(+)